MFHVCPKCKRRWEYPLSECPYCFVPLRKMESKKIRVNSAAKVTIPTLFHPSVPYYVLILEDELGNLWGYKSEKEYKPGDEFALEADPDAVAVWRVKYSALEAVEKALELAGGINAGENSKVVVLPTLAKPSHAYFRDNASPEFLGAVLQILLDRGVKADNITVASQSFDELPSAAAAQKSGLIDAGAKFKVAALDLATAGFEQVGRFEISKPVLAADLVVNLAMEKMGQASATENLFKVLKKENYLGQKYLSSEAEIVADLELALDKTIVIGEAENVQRSSKLTTFMGLVLAGRSSRRVDRVFNEIAQSFMIPEIIKGIDLAAVPIAGRTIKEVQYQAEIF